MSETSSIKKVVKVVTALVLALVLAWVALANVVATDGFRESAINAIGTQWRGQVNIAAISLEFPATVVVEKLSLAERGGGAAWVAFSEARISPSYSAPFSRAGLVEVKGLAARLRQRGRLLEPLNLIGPCRRPLPPGRRIHRTPPPAGKKVVCGDQIAAALVGLPIETLKISDGTITFEQTDPTLKMKVPIKNIAGVVFYDHSTSSLLVQAKGATPFGGQIDIDARGTVSNGDIRRFSGDIKVATDRVDVATIPKMLPQEMADFLGNVSGLFALQVTGSLLGTDLQGLNVLLQGQRIDIPLPLGSLISSSLNISLDVDERQKKLDGILDASGLRLTGAATTENAGGQSLRVEVRRDGVILRIEKLESMSHSGQISGSGFFSIGAGSLFSILVGGFPAYEIELIAASLDMGETSLTQLDGSSVTQRAVADRVKARLVPGALEVAELDLVVGDQSSSLSGTLTLQMGGMVEGTLVSPPEQTYDAFISGLLWAPNVQLTPKVYDGTQEGQ